MSDVGFSSRFEIYLTKSNGVQIVTNELSLSILKEMRFHEVSPSDIAAELGLPKSTVQASLTKLLRTGIVMQESRVSDARSVIYRLSGHLMFCSDTDVDWQLYARTASTKRILGGGRCTSREDLSLYGVSITESGLNIVQGLFNIGAALASGPNGRAVLERMLSQMREQSERYGIAVDMITKNGLQFKFESISDNISDVPLIIVPMLGAIISHSKELLGYNLSHDVSLKVSNNGYSVSMKVEPFVGQDYEESTEEFIAHNRTGYYVNDPFSIYSIDGVSTLFTNSTMMDILYDLSMKDMSVNDLEEAMGISKATIYASLMKLVEMGAVEVDPNSGSPKKYKLIADPILYCTDVNPEGADIFGKIIERFQTGSLDYYSSVIAYAMECINVMGMHFDQMFIRSGGSTARTVIGILPEIEPERLLDVACEMISYPDSAEIVTKIPLKIRVNMSPDTLWENWPADFIRGFIAEGLKILTGDEYKMQVDVVRT